MDDIFIRGEEGREAIKGGTFPFLHTGAAPHPGNGLKFETMAFIHQTLQERVNALKNYQTQTIEAISRLEHEGQTDGIEYKSLHDQLFRDTERVNDAMFHLAEFDAMRWR